MPEFAAVFDLSALDGDNGFQLDGIAIGDNSGRPVASAGDVNGDGFADLIVGAYWADPGGDSGAGASFVVFGKAAGFAAGIGLASLDGSNGFRLDGIDVDDHSGIAVAGAGDVNGDGFGDIIIGAYAADPGSDLSAGESYVVFGKASGFAASLDLSALDGDDGFRLDGIDAYDRSGRAVAAAGDVNGDGFADVIIGASSAAVGSDYGAGESYVVFGKASGFAASLDLGGLDGKNGFRLDGAEAGDHSGVSVAGAGDVNGDGIDDVIIGADGGGAANAGSTYVVFGKTSGFAASLDLASIDGKNGFRLDGIGLTDLSGHTVASAGDVNGDGFADLIIGAFRTSLGSDKAAIDSYVVFGSGSGFAASINLSALDGSNGFKIDGINSNDLSAYQAGVGDVNGDGFDDVIVGAPYSNPGGASTAGQSFVVFGKASGFTAVFDVTGLDGGNGFRLDGIDGGDHSGSAVAGAGDVNGDGFADLIVGAHRADPGGNAAAGESYVVFGHEALEAVTRTGTAIANIIHGGVGADTVSGLGGDDWLFGRGSNDTMNGGGGNDTLDGGEGDDKLIGRAGADTLDGGGGTDVVTYAAEAAVTIDLGDNASNAGAALGDTLTGIEDVAGSYLGGDTITGGGQNNRLWGHGGGDTLKGMGGNDLLTGGDGNDDLDGGAGKDRFKGGDGNDVFRFTALADMGNGATTRDRVLDFVQGEDTIDLSAVASFTFGAIDGSGPRADAAGDGNGNTIVSGDADGDLVVDFQILLVGAFTLAAADFTF